LISLLLIVAFHVVSGSLPQPDSRKKKIEILNADLYTYDRKIVADADRLIGHVELSHNNVLLYCDSAYSYKDSNMVDAFGHVHIIQGDTLNLYGDRIKYEGNSKIAKVKGNVKLVNKSITLTTDELTFDLRANIGNYHTWGKIVDTANVLVSKIGRYYSNEDLFFFKDSVKVTNKDFILTADTLKYNSKTERVFIVGPTHIVGTSKKGTLYSEKGWYDTRTNIAELYKASKIIGKEQSLQGDTIFYSRNAGTGRARSRVLLSDTTNHIAITGRNGIYNEKTKIAFVTDSAIFMQFSKKDTLFLHADTLKSIPDISKPPVIKKMASQPLVAKKSALAKSDSSKIIAGKKDSTLQIPLKKDSSLQIASKKDSLIEKIDTLKVAALLAGKKSATQPDSLNALADTSKILPTKPLDLKEQPLVKDSLHAVSDSIKKKDDQDKKIFMAYHRVRFYKKDLQGICDSLAYQMKDSVMRLFKDPVLWSEVHQLTAEKIEYRPHIPGPDIARLENNGFIISREDSIKYNQISGKLLLGYIYNNALKKIEVNGNAITLYYLKNKDHYSGMNKLESSKINVYLLKGKIDSISFFPKPEGKTIPLKDLTPDEAMLKGFLWRESEKPKNRFDLYPLDEKRKKIAGPEKKPASPK
jgi:lipopolysaccharide export system protein LptA